MCGVGVGSLAHRGSADRLRHLVMIEDRQRPACVFTLVLEDEASDASFGVRLDACDGHRWHRGLEDRGLSFAGRLLWIALQRFSSRDD